MADRDPSSGASDDGDAATGDTATDDATTNDATTDGPPITGEELVETFPGYRGEEASIVEIPPREAVTALAESTLPPALAGPLCHDLYSHQALALDALDRGENVCVATSTASGKTLVYALQIARNAIATSEAVEDDATAYVLYPTKALARDQERELTDRFDELGLDLTVRVYDGDTEAGETRRRIRNEADVIISNFAGVNTYLHDHDRWARFFRACDLVVIDESHTYTGVHGMHVAWIVRRLKRVLAYYDADPQFVLTSATVGNPGEHSEALIDEPVTVIDDDGSPRGPRDLILWNPPPRARTDGDRSEQDVDMDGQATTSEAIDAGTEAMGTGPGARDTGTESKDTDEHGILERVPATVEAPRVFSHLTYHDAQTLLFTPSRKLAELSVKRARRHRQDRRRYYTDPTRGTALEPYHAGHSREKRHATEYGLTSGTLEGVASTNALELGINVGAMDATVQLGYPGQRQSFWQQIGRAGRGTDRALSVLVAEHRTLDQYVVAHPDYLLESGVEDAVVDASNDAVFSQHVRCAADELALTEADTSADDDTSASDAERSRSDRSDYGAFAERERLQRAVEMWRRAGQLTGHLETGVSYAGPPRPQSTISLYATSGEEYEVRLAEGVDDRHDPEMEPLARERVFRDFHEGAVRLHEGRQYEICAVVHDARRPSVTVRPTDVDYYTRTRTEVTVLDAESETSREVNGFDLYYGTGRVLVYHGSYDRVSVNGGKPSEQGIPTNLPPLTMDTQLCWLEVPREIERALIERYRDVSVPELSDGGGAHLGYVGGLHAAEHATIGVAPLELMLDKRDLGGLATLTIDSHLTQDVPQAGAEHDSRSPQSIVAAQARVRRLTDELDCEPASGWFVYDGVEGGLGFSRAIYDDFEAVASRARALVADCGCGRVDGCPACVMDEQCGNDNRPLHRGAAVDVLDQLLGNANRDALREHLPEDGHGGDRRPPLFYS